MARIFLCYARPDEIVVGDLYSKLSKEGFSPWMDQKDILPGEKWEASIKRAIQHSDFFLACLSQHSVSRRGFLQKEIKAALDIWQEKLEHDIYLIPVRLDDCETPDTLSGFQWVNLFEECGFERLASAIRTGIDYRYSIDEHPASRPGGPRPAEKPSQIEVLDFAVSYGNSVQGRLMGTTDSETFLGQLEEGTLPIQTIEKDPLTIDIKLTNRGEMPAVITRCSLDIAEVGLIYRDLRWSGLCSGLPSSASYDVLLSPLDGPGERLINIAQVLRPKEIDRFKLELWSKRNPETVVHKPAAPHHWGDALLFIVYYCARVSLSLADGSVTEVGRAILPFAFPKRSFDTWLPTAYLAAPGDVVPTREYEPWILHTIRKELDLSRVPKT